MCLIPYAFLAGCWLGYDFGYGNFRIEPLENSTDETNPDLQWIMTRILEAEHYDCERLAELALTTRRNVSSDHACAHPGYELAVGYSVDDLGITLEIRGRRRNYEAGIGSLLASIEAANLRYTLVR